LQGTAVSSDKSLGKSYNKFRYLTWGVRVRMH